MLTNSEPEKSINPLVRIFGRILHKLKTLFKVTFSSSFRAQWTMEKFKKDRVQQTTQMTWENRYPDIFLACQNFFSGIKKEDIKILSYGCCTGEEVITLRRYFPKAVIVGAELNKNSLKICRKRDCDSNIHFIYSTPKSIQKYGPYDAVFCMAVLERLPMVVKEKNITDLKKMYPFDKFEKQIHEIDTYVKEEGLLIAHFTHYDLMDTDIKDRYSALGVHGFTGTVFGKDSKIKKKEGFQQSIFIKQKSNIE